METQSSNLKEGPNGIGNATNGGGCAGSSGYNTKNYCEMPNICKGNPFPAETRKLGIQVQQRLLQVLSAECTSFPFSHLIIWLLYLLCILSIRSVRLERVE